MQKIKKVFLSLIIFCIVSLSFPFVISADTTYYSGGSQSDPITAFDTSQYSLFFYTDDYVRVVAIINGSATYLFGVSDTSGYHVYRKQSNVQNWTTTNIDNSSKYPDNNGVTFYYRQVSSITTSSITNMYLNTVTYETNNPNYSDIAKCAYYYTFGGGAVDPTPSTNYGDLVVGFHTNFSASGTTNNYSITNNTNLDTIEWENVDSNGNDLQNKGINVEIRAVPILYSASSKSALDLLGFQDAVVDSNNGLILWQGNFNDNHKSFIWNDVIRQLQTSNPAFTITSLLTGSVWTRYGWIYQIRYNDVLNDYSSDWQTIYNSTSIKVSDSEKIVNQYYYHYPSGVGSDDQDIFHDINTVNNTTNNWYVNDVPVDPDASWLDSLIQAIAEILGKILDFFSSIFDGLVDLLLGLFGDVNPADSFFNWFSDLFNGIGDIDLTLPQFNIPTADLSSFNRLVQETMDIFSLNNFGFVIFIPLLLIIIKAVF